MTTTFDRDGRKEIVTRSANGLTEVSVTEKDVAGRVTLLVDERGVQQRYEYNQSDNSVTVRGPGGQSAITKVTKRYLDGRTKIEAGNGQVPTYTTFAINGEGLLSKTQFIGTTDASSQRHRTEVYDWSERTVSSSWPDPSGPGFLTETREYNATGRPSKIAGGGRAATILVYDALGNLRMRGMDLATEPAAPDGELQLESEDRIEELDTKYLKLQDRWWKQTSSRSYRTDNQDDEYYEIVRRHTVGPVSSSGAAMDSAVVIHPGGLTQTHETYSSFGSRSVTQTWDLSSTSGSPDSTETSVAGRLTATWELGAAQSGAVEYDPWGRPSRVIDTKGRQQRFGYNSDGQLASIREHDGDSMLVDYYPLNDWRAGLRRAISIDEKLTQYDYNSLALLTEITGTAEYRRNYEYDVYGDLVKVTTFAGGVSGDATTWVRDPRTGLVTSKKYPDLKGPTFTYWPDGQIKSRTWARGAVTAWTYDDAGDVKRVDYPSGTADVEFERDRLGRPSEITDGGGTLQRSYSAETFAQTSDAYSVSHAWLPGITVDQATDPLTGRVIYSGVRRGAAWDQKAEFAYHPQYAITDVGAGLSHIYTVDPATGAVTNIEHKLVSSNATVARQSRRLDLAGNLYGVETSGSNQVVLQRHGYAYDGRGKRTRVTREDGSYWAFDYNSRGELVSGKKYISASPPVPLAGVQFEYEFDGLGNRVASRSGGNDSGTGLRQTTYQSNTLNQYGLISSPNSFDILGTAPAEQAVTVNSFPALRQEGGRYRAEIVVNNATGPVWQDITVSNGTPPNKTGKYRVEADDAELEYDDDGNLTSDGRWSYVWDAENRLVSMANETSSINHRAPGEPYRRLVFDYDWRGRRVRKQVFDGPAATVAVEDRRFCYDGWNLVAEYLADGSNVALKASYTWGLDISGTLEGAWGVGGVLSAEVDGIPYVASYDGNGNIVGWVDGAGNLAGVREYAPFGSPVIQHGLDDLAISFSSKYRDRESGLYYYGDRYFNPDAGRWLSRDPEGEAGGLNCYAFAGNDMIGSVDPLGRKIYTGEDGKYRKAVLDALSSITKSTFRWDKVEKLPRKIEDMRKPEYWCLADAGPPVETDLYLKFAGGDTEKRQDQGAGHNAYDEEPPTVELKEGEYLDSAVAKGDNSNYRPVELHINYVANIKVAEYVFDYSTGVSFPTVDWVQNTAFTFDVTLWHELAGHTIMSTNHPFVKENVWEYVDLMAKTKPEKWTKFNWIDPTIKEENEARSALRKPMRRPQYIDFFSDVTRKMDPPSGFDNAKDRYEEDRQRFREKAEKRYPKSGR